MNLGILAPLRGLQGGWTNLRGPRHTVPERTLRKKIAGKRVVVTGATDGIGRNLAKLLSAQGANVLIVGRRPRSEIETSLSSGQIYLQADLTDAKTPARLSQVLDDIGWRSLDLLVHNAAAGWVGPTEHQPLGSLDRLLTTNLVAPCALSHALLPYLRPARGRIVFIGSVVTDKTCPSYAVYGATKAALQGFARSLKLELSGEVEVQVVHPGPTRTGFHRKSGYRMDTSWRNCLLASFFLDPHEVAAVIVRRIEKGPMLASAGHMACFLEKVRRSGRAA